MQDEHGRVAAAGPSEAERVSAPDEQEDIAAGRDRDSVAAGLPPAGGLETWPRERPQVEDGRCGMASASVDARNPDELGQPRAGTMVQGVEIVSARVEGKSSFRW